MRTLLEVAAGRLHQLCATLLYRSYPRLTRGPSSLQSDEMLSAVVERLIKAMRNARPGNVRQFFQIANQHMRWELNDMARRLDEHTRVLGSILIGQGKQEEARTLLEPLTKQGSPVQRLLQQAPP